MVVSLSLPRACLSLSCCMYVRLSGEYQIASPMSVCLRGCLYRCVCYTVYPVSVCLDVCLSLSVSFCLSVSLSVFLCLSLFVYLCLPAKLLIPCLSVCLPVCLCRPLCTETQPWDRPSALCNHRPIIKPSLHRCPPQMICFFVSVSICVCITPSGLVYSYDIFSSSRCLSLSVCSASASP